MRKASVYRATRHRAYTVGEDIENAYVKGYEQCLDDTFRWLIKKHGDMAVATQYFNEMKKE